jgi:hypothetical protein
LLKILALAKGTYSGDLPLNPKNSLLTNLSIMSIMGRWALKSFFQTVGWSHPHRTTTTVTLAAALIDCFDFM